MDRYERFDKYFVCSYFNEIGQKVGVFDRKTPENVINEVKKIFEIVEID